MLHDRVVACQYSVPVLCGLSLQGDICTALAAWWQSC
jgi:hypothetical protein